MIVGGPTPLYLRKIIPILSPLTILSELIMQGKLYTSFYWFLPSLILIVLAFFKRRFFCNNICPMGTIYELPQQILKTTNTRKSFYKKIKIPRLNVFFFWMIISGSFIGCPFILWSDPLSTINRVSFWRECIMWIPGGIIPLMFLFSFFQPKVWCTHFCPLGYFFDIISNISNRKSQDFSKNRRLILTGLAAGGLTSFLPKIIKKKTKPPILPPGAISNFSDVCTRCYACVATCDLDVIKIKTDGNLNEWFMPELYFKYEGCEEFCTDCSQVCPTGAISLLSEKEKRHRKIGEATINRKACLSWEDNKDCMVCHEFCPYSAIKIHTKKNQTACPIIIPDLCRGCGACECNCPAERNGKAIIISPVTPQTVITRKPKANMNTLNYTQRG